MKPYSNNAMLQWPLTVKFQRKDLKVLTLLAIELWSLDSGKKLLEIKA